MAQSVADAIIAIPTEPGGAPMANVPGVVTDPSRIKGGVIALPSGGTNIAAYLATPNQPGSYPGIVVIQEAFGLVDHICDVADVVDKTESLLDHDDPGVEIGRAHV